MKNSIQVVTSFLILFFGFTSEAQQKKWTLQECVEYAFKNNISIKQSALDLKATSIDKKIALGNFLPNLNVLHIQQFQKPTYPLLRNKLEVVRQKFRPNKCLL